MAVENSVSMEAYTLSAYQNNKDINKNRKESSNKKDSLAVDTDSGKQNDIKRASDSGDKAPITLESVRNKDLEPDIDEKIQDFIEGQKYVHDKIRKSLDDYSSRMGNYEAKFGMHEATNRVMIKLVDKDTKEVIKELPPEKTLDMIAKCLEQAGILVDEKV